MMMAFRRNKLRKKRDKKQQDFWISEGGDKAFCKQITGIKPATGQW